MAEFDLKHRLRALRDGPLARPSGCLVSRKVIAAAQSSRHPPPGQHAALFSSASDGAVTNPTLARRAAFQQILKESHA